MNHKELFDQDLRGWRLTTAFFLELQHGLMGFFPAVFADEKAEMFVCLDKSTLALVGEYLTPRRCKITELKVLANYDKAIAFDLGRLNEERYREDPKKDTHIAVLTQGLFNKLTDRPGEKKIFKWAPGLIGNDMNREEFLETLHAAARSVDT